MPETNKVTVTVGDEQINMRIRARMAEPLTERLGGRAFMDALMDIPERPVENVIPFLWAANQPPRESGQTFSDDDAYDLYDRLVDAGYEPMSFFKLVVDICTASGFFVKGLTDRANQMIERMDQLLTELDEKPKEKKTKSG